MFELGGLSKDTVELRDGTILLCDVLFMSMAQITVFVAGQDQAYDRNRVKKLCSWSERSFSNLLLRSQIRSSEVRHRLP